MRGSKTQVLEPKKLVFQVETNLSCRAGRRRPEKKWKVGKTDVSRVGSDTLLVSWVRAARHLQHHK